jgi:hypothetical protein
MSPEEYFKAYGNRELTEEERIADPEAYDEESALANLAGRKREADAALPKEDLTANGDGYVSDAALAAVGLTRDGRRYKMRKEFMSEAEYYGNNTPQHTCSYQMAKECFAQSLDGREMTEEERESDDHGDNIVGTPVADSVNSYDNTQSIRLNIGGGTHAIEGFVTVDRHWGGEAYPLKVPITEDGPERYDSHHLAGQVDEIYASHILEHLPQRDTVNAIKEWVKCLKVNGRLRIAVPDTVAIAKQIVEGNPHNLPLMGYIYGGQTDENDFHKNGFDEPGLRKMMQDAGLSSIKRFAPVIDDCSALPISLNLEGVKATFKPPQRLAKIPATSIVMSMPRLAFTSNMDAMVRMAVAYQLPFERVEGAYFHQCMERGMTKVVEAGTSEWIVTADYDSYFELDQFTQLANLMLKHPEIDAIAPMQAMRDNDRMLTTAMTGNNDSLLAYLADSQSAVDEIIQVATAHFGLTIFRTAALRHMKHPWFYETPNDQGRWDEGRSDADLGFWRNFNEAGNKLFLATQVPLGHCQQMVTLPDQDLKPRHVYMREVQNSQYPAWVRGQYKGQDELE